MFVDSIVKVTKSMFPVFRTWSPEPGKTTLSAAGTGFFVSADGLFISVAHVFSNDIANASFKYYGRLPTDLQSPPLDVQEVARDNSKDILVGRIAIKPPAFLSVAPELAPIGRSVCIGGYPLAALSLNATGGIELGGVKRYFQPTFVLDYSQLQAKLPGGTMCTHDGFLVRDFGLFGMSGGPVFDTAGVVVGMQASVTDPRDSVSGDGKKISVQNGQSISSNVIISFLKEKGIAL